MSASRRQTTKKFILKLEQQKIRKNIHLIKFQMQLIPAVELWKFVSELSSSAMDDPYILHSSYLRTIHL